MASLFSNVSIHREGDCATLLSQESLGRQASDDGVISPQSHTTYSKITKQNKNTIGDDTKEIPSEVKVPRLESSSKQPKSSTYASKIADLKQTTNDPDKRDRDRVREKRKDGKVKESRSSIKEKSELARANLLGLTKFIESFGTTYAGDNKFKEAKQDPDKKIPVLPVDQILYANKAAFMNHGQYKHCSFVEHPEGVDIDGEFVFGFGRDAITVCLHVFAPYAPYELRKTKNTLVSGCQLLIFGPDIQGELMTDSREPCVDSTGDTYPVASDNKSRIRLIARGWIDRAINSKCHMDEHIIKNQIISEYKRYYRNYPELAGHVNSVLLEKWYLDSLTKFHEAKAIVYHKRAEARIAAYCSSTGISKEELYIMAGLREVGESTLFVGKPTVALFTALGMRKYFTNTITNVLAIASGLATLAAGASVAYRWLYSPGFRNGLTEVILNQNNPLQSKLVPASMAYIKKTMHPPHDRVVSELWSSVELKSPETHAYKDDETVAMYGVQTDAPMVYPANTLANLEQALRIRAGFDRVVDENKARAFKQFCIRLLKELPDIDVGTPETERFFTNKYGLKKGERIAKLVHEPLEEKDRWSDLFIKGEAYLGKDEDSYKSRMIWSRTEKFLAHHLPACDAVSKGLAKVFNKFSHIYYTSGATVADVSNFAEKLRLRPFIKELDVSSFDGSLLESMLEVEQWFLENKVVGTWPEKEWFISNHSNVWGRSKDGELSYKASHGRRSGDPITSCFNSLQNILLTMWACDIRGWDSEFTLMVAGDDGVVSLDFDVPSDLITARYAELGMKVGAIDRDSIFDTEFCSGLFWNVAGRPYWGNLPFRQLAKFGMNHGKHPEHLFPSLLHGMSKSLLPSAGHVPVLGAMLRAISYSGDESKIKERRDLRFENPYRFQGGPSFYPTDETFMQFSDRYGMDLDTVFSLHLAASAVHINLFPMTFRGLEVDIGLKVDVGLKDILPRPFTYNELDNDYHEVVIVAPREEEMAKLAGVTSIMEAVESGRRFGLEEVSLGAPHTHILLHQLFSAISYLNLELGVAIHSAYNHIAYVGGITPATRNRLRRNVEKYEIPMPKSMQEARRVAEMIARGEVLEVKTCPTCGQVLEVSDVIPAAKKKIKRSGGGKKKSGFRDGIRKAIGLGIRGAGAAAGGYFGQPALGAAAGAWLSKATGFGDIKIKVNSLTSKGVPSFGSGSPRVFRFTHKEFLGDIRGSEAFTIRSYELNPGLFASFPWGSKIASQFTQYSFLGVIFMYNATSASALNSTNTALGTVIMATQYNPGKPDYVSKIEMEASQFSCSTRPSESLMHVIECDPRDRPLLHSYVRTGALSSSEDPRLYDLAVFQIATAGMQAEATIGELWVTYEIELLYPRVSPGLYDGLLSVAINNGAYDNNDVFSAIQTTPVGSLPVTISSSGTYYDRILFDSSISAGRFKVDVYWRGSSAAVTLATPVYSNLTRDNSSDADYWGFRQGVVGDIYCPASGATATQVHYSAILSVDGYSSTGSYIQLTGMTLPSSGSCVDIYISPIPFDYSQ